MIIFHIALWDSHSDLFFTGIIFYHLTVFLGSVAEGRRPATVKNLEEMRQSVVREFLASCRASKSCVHCHSPFRPIRQESHIKILHGRMPSSRVIKNMLTEKIKLATFYLCCCVYCIDYYFLKLVECTVMSLIYGIVSRDICKYISLLKSNSKLRTCQKHLIVDYSVIV